ncbi:MAG: hypothetical protein ACTIB7_12780 [Brevibacterium aurantiacum]
MTTAYRHRKILTYSAIALAATVLPLLMPFSATLLGWALEVPMRLALSESLLATFGILVAWFVISRLIDVILDGSDIGGTVTGRLVSAATSMVLLGGGYFLIVDSAIAALLMAVAVCSLPLVMSILLQRREGASQERHRT